MINFKNYICTGPKTTNFTPELTVYIFVLFLYLYIYRFHGYPSMLGRGTKAEEPEEPLLLHYVHLNPPSEAKLLKMPKKCEYLP